jgi:hypothetical protein
MTSPAERYAAARRTAQARPPADPQSTLRGGPAALDRVMQQARRCRTVTPAGTVCGHSGVLHDETGACSVTEVPDLTSGQQQTPRACGCTTCDLEQP